MEEFIEILDSVGLYKDIAKLIFDYKFDRKHDQITNYETLLDTGDIVYSKILKDRILCIRVRFTKSSQLMFYLIGANKFKKLIGQDKTRDSTDEFAFEYENVFYFYNKCKLYEIDIDYENYEYRMKIINVLHYFDASFKIQTSNDHIYTIYYYDNNPDNWTVKYITYKDFLEEKEATIVKVEPICDVEAIRSVEEWTKENLDCICYTTTTSNIPVGSYEYIIYKDSRYYKFVCDKNLLCGRLECKYKVEDDCYSNICLDHQIYDLEHMDRVRRNNPFIVDYYLNGFSFYIPPKYVNPVIQRLNNHIAIVKCIFLGKKSKKEIMKSKIVLLTY